MVSQTYIQIRNQTDKSIQRDQYWARTTACSAVVIGGSRYIF